MPFGNRIVQSALPCHPVDCILIARFQHLVAPFLAKEGVCRNAQSVVSSEASAFYRVQIRLRTQMHPLVLRGVRGMA
ncbi:hypothetical protein WJ69_15620 [Burkholderia ubonensis]|nr:hypothetical protein WJ69_15620 [Burkholderia ubonensis]